LSELIIVILILPANITALTSAIRHLFSHDYRLSISQDIPSFPPPMGGAFDVHDHGLWGNKDDRWWWASLG